MPQIRAEQIQNETIMDLQIAVNAAIQQSKIEDWTSDPAGWISEGIVKVMENEPVWESGGQPQQEGQLYYINSSDELHLGIGTDPWHIVLGSPAQHGWDAELTVKNGDQADDWTGTTGTQFSVTSQEFTVDGSDLYVYLNGAIQRLGASYDFTIVDSTTIQFTHNIFEDDTVTMIVVISPLVLGYATKAWVINRYEEDLVDVGASRVRVNPTGNITSTTVQDALEELQTDINNVVAGTIDINVSMDDAYDDGSTITVDSTDVIWNASAGRHFTINSPAATPLFDVDADAAGNSITLGANVSLSGDIIPSATETYDLGSSGAKFAEIHAQTGYFDAATVYLGPTAQLKFDGSRFQFTNDGATFLNAVGTIAGADIILEGRVLPDGQNTRDFGSDTAAWKDYYVGSSINFVPVGDAGDVARIYRNVSGSNTEMRFQIGQGSSDKIIFEDEGQTALLTIDGDGGVLISGDLTVTGTQTSVESTNTQVNDTTFTIAHKDVAADGDASFIVERAVTHAKITWNDSIDTWQMDPGTGTAGDVLFHGYDNYIYTNKSTNALGIGATPLSTLDVVTSGNTTAAVRTSAANGQTSTISIEGASTSASTDVSILSFEDNSNGTYDPLVKLVMQKQNTADQGKLLIQTNKGGGSYGTITIDKDSNVAFSSGGQFTPGSTTPSGSSPMAWEGDFYATKVYNAVWNDIADFFEVENEVEVQPGRAYVLDEDGNARLSNCYMEEGIIGIASDTFGYGLGKKDIANEIPIGVAGIVLAYVQPNLRPGTPLTVGPNGVLVEMKPQDKPLYPERIVATFYRKEDRQTLGEGDNQIQVNNRCWVKIR